MEFVPANNLEQLLPEPGMKTRPAGRSANVTNDQFQHHLQASTQTSSTSAPLTDESQPEETEADAQPPLDASPVEVDSTGNDSEAAEKVDSAEAEADASQLKEPANGIKESESRETGQAATAAATPEVIASASSGQDTKSHSEDSDVATEALTAGKVDPQTGRNATPSSQITQDQATRPPGSSSEEQGVTAPTEPGEEPHEARDDAKKTVRTQSGENLGVAKKPGHEHKITAEPDQSAQQLKTDEWTELPECGNKENQSLSPSSNQRSDVNGNALNGEVRGDTNHGRLREGSATRSTDSPRESGELNHGEQARLVQRVSRAIESAQLRGGPLRLRLSPPELGSLRLEITVEKGVLSAKIEAESQMARAVLLDNLPQLRDRLSEQGVQIENFDVDVSDHLADHTQQHTDDAHNHEEHRSNRAFTDKQQQEEKGAPTESPISLNKGKLNIVV